MPRRLLVPLLLLTVVATAATAQNDDYYRFEVIMEGGLAVPLGNLGTSYLNREGALGAEQGFNVGLRTRIYLSPTLSLAPNFSYTEFGDYDGLYDDGTQFKVETRVLTYGLDLTLMQRGRYEEVRGFGGVGAAFLHDKYREEYVVDETYYDAAVNSLGWSLHAGIRWRDWEVAADYQYNTFSTTRFLLSAEDIDYDWSRLLLRVSFVLPRI